jgi:integrase
MDEDMINVDMEYDSDNLEDNTPPEIGNLAKEVTLNLLPSKSRIKYEKTYELFKSWCSSKKVNNVTENVLIAYMSTRSKTLAPSTLWSIYSMLKTTLNVKENLDISRFNKLTAFLKQQNVGYKPKKSKILNKDEVKTFLLTAHDDVHLLHKVILIFGVAGACRRDELTKMQLNDVQDKDSIFIVNVRDTKTHINRTFTITNDEEGEIDYLSICRKYISLRPANATTSRLFIKYQNGKCTNQNIGMNTVAKVPKDIAEFLKLPEPQLYTGHCFRRTSATLLANAGGDLTQIKRHGGWKSSTVAEGYIEDAITNKIDTSKKILGHSTSTVVECKKKEEHHIESMSTSGVIIQQNEHCTFNITIVNKKD